MRKRDLGTLAVGMALGATLTGGAVAAGITAQPAWPPIYVDGRPVEMTAYDILGNNYVKPRDIGKEVGFNVYYQDGAQVDSKNPYTGEAPVKADLQPTGSGGPPGQQRGTEGKRTLRTASACGADERHSGLCRPPDTGSQSV